MTERFAIYYAPAVDDAMWLAASQWLGRDCASGQTYGGMLAGLPREALASRSVSARRYGFHATIKAPMRLAFGMTATSLVDGLERFARRTAPVAIGATRLKLIDGFLAIVPEVQSSALTAFAAEVVHEFDRFRAPASPEERDRRQKSGNLTQRQIELMERLGYPYVLEQFQLHMTLTDRLAPEDQETYRRAAEVHFGALAHRETRLDRLVLYHEPQAGAPFWRLGEFPLEGEAKP
jgi:hypothetical protein